MRPWILRIYGAIELRNPELAQVDLPSRKIAELLFLLNENRVRRLTRDQLCEVLWPEAEPSRARASLRQALAMLRKIIGEKSVNANASLCALSADFLVLTDQGNPELRKSALLSAALDPSFVETLTTSDPSRSEVVSAASHFYSYVTYLARYESTRTIATLRENVPMVHALSSGQLGEILSRVSDPNALPGWQAYFRGIYLTETSQIPQSYRKFQEARLIARETSDLPLTIQSLGQLTLNCAFRGLHEEASQWTADCRAVAMQTLNPNLKATAALTTGTYMIHRGEFEKGSVWLSRAEQLYTNSIDAHAVRSIRRYVGLSFSDRIDDESQREDTLTVARESGHVLMGWFTHAADASLALRHNHPHDALAPLTQTATLARATKNNVVVVYALDALRRGYVKAKMKSEATMIHRESLAIRRQIAMHDSVWDRMVVG